MSVPNSSYFLMAFVGLCSMSLRGRWFVLFVCVCVRVRVTCAMNREASLQLYKYICALLAIISVLLLLLLMVISKIHGNHSLVYPAKLSAAPLTYSEACKAAGLLLLFIYIAIMLKSPRQDYSLFVVSTLKTYQCFLKLI